MQNEKLHKTLIPKILCYLTLDKMFYFSKNNKYLSSNYLKIIALNEFSTRKLNSIESKFEIFSGGVNENLIENKFCCFKNFRGDNFIIWSDAMSGITIYNINKFRIEFYIEKAHSGIILSLSYLNNNQNKSVYIISSSNDKTLKIWQLNEGKYQLVTELLNIYTGSNDKSYSIFSHLAFNENINSNLCEILVTSSYFDTKIKLMNFKGQQVCEVDGGERVSNLTHYYSATKKINYIIMCGIRLVKSFLLKNSKIKFYKTYFTTPVNHLSAIINEKEQLICLDSLGIVRIWDFHKSELLFKFLTCSNLVGGFCLWNEDSILISARNSMIFSYSLKGKIQAEFSTGESSVLCIKKLIHNKYGSCIVICDTKGCIKFFSE